MRAIVQELGGPHILDVEESASAYDDQVAFVDGEGGNVSCCTLFNVEGGSGGTVGGIVFENCWWAVMKFW